MNAAHDPFLQQILQLKTEISVLRDKLADENKRTAKADAARVVAEAAAAEAQAAVQVSVETFLNVRGFQLVTSCLSGSGYRRRQMQQERRRQHWEMGVQKKKIC